MLSRVEALEARHLLAANLFIQGTAFVDGNNDGRLDPTESYLPGATIKLFSGTTQIGQAITGPDGQYVFNDSNNLFPGNTLTPGTYKVVEQPAGLYTNTQASALSQINPASVLDSSTIQVTLVDPSTVTTTFDFTAYAARFSAFYARVNPAFVGQPTINGSTQPVGQLPITVTRPGVGTTPEFYSFCTDILADLTGNNTYPTTLSPDHSSLVEAGMPGNAGRIGYLYNHFGVNPDGTTPTLTRVQAGALQLAIDLLLYNASVPNNPTVADLHSGTFQIGTPADARTAAEFPAIEAQILAYLTASGGKNEKVIFLDATQVGVSPTPNGRQSMIATGSLNFGNRLLAPASLSGFVYADSNNDGTFDATETPIAGVSVTLTGSNDLGPIAPVTVMTGADGSYSFGNLRPGTYAVTEAQPAGYLDGKDTIGTQGGTPANDAFGAIALAAGVNGVNNNFGELLPGSLSGFVYVDANNDGLKDTGETPLSGVTLTLSGTDDLGAVTSRTTMTDAGGAYSFGNLRPGTYTVAETQPAGYLDGKDARNNVVISGSSNGPDAVTGIPVVQALDSALNNFGELAPALISGFAYVDSNNDGIKGAGEAPIPGVSVTLTGSNDLGSIAPVTVMTGADGSYSFPNLRPGTYAIAEAQPAGYLDGKDAVGTVNNVADGTLSGTFPVYDQISNAVLASGNQGVNYNFGELAPAQLSGYVYVDADDDGIKEAGEAGLAGVTVTLSGTNDLGTIVPITVTTGADGSYRFGNLRPGTYTVTEAQPAGYTTTGNSVGTVGGQYDGRVVGDTIDQIVLGGAAAGVEYNFGELNAGSALVRGQTATIGFWNNKNGQALILSLNGGPTATNLGNWLASSFGNIYSNLAGKSNAEVAAYFQTLFKQTGQKTAAQFLAGALAAYATNTALAGGAYAAGYGFTVSANGTGIATYNVGTLLAPFGGPTGQVSIIALIQFVNSKSVDGLLANGNAALLNAINTIFSGINQTGDIK